MDLFCKLIGEKSHLFSPSFQCVLTSDHKEIAIMSDDPSDFYLAGSIRAHVKFPYIKEDAVYGFIDFLLSEKPEFVSNALAGAYRSYAKKFIEQMNQ